MGYYLPKTKIPKERRNRLYAYFKRVLRELRYACMPQESKMIRKAHAMVEETYKRLHLETLEE